MKKAFTTTFGILMGIYTAGIAMNIMIKITNTLNGKDSEKEEKSEEKEEES